MDKEKLNVFANAVLEVLPEEGCPESYLYVAAEQAGLNPAAALDILVMLELLRREGQIIKPGPKWALALEAKKNFERRMTG